MSVFTATGFSQTAASASAVNQGRFDISSNALASPSDLQYYYCQRGHTALRQVRKLRADKTIYITGNSNVIKFDLPSDNFYDFRRGHISFDVQVQVTGGTYFQLADGIWSMFYRMQTETEIETENLQEYNRWVSFMYETQNEGRQTQVLFHEAAGVGTPAERRIWAASPKRYRMPLISGFLGTQILPMHRIGAQCRLTLTLDDASKFVETDGTIPIVTLTNVIFHCERVVVDASLFSRLDSAFASSGLKLGFLTFNDYSQNIPNGTTGKVNVVINQKFASLHDMVGIWVQQGVVNNTTVNDKFTNWPRLTTAHQTVINGSRVPEEEVSYADPLADEAFMNYCKWLEKWDLSGLLPMTPVPIGNQEFARGNKFFIIVDFNQYPYDKDVINPMSNISDAIQWQMDLTLAAPLTEVMRFQILARYFRQIVIFPDKRTQVIL